ncbi:phage tail protein [Enterobacter hormaechei]|uniref:phage tail protein n=1 Tax=Enterobacter hormaechei TaxID=158836 RepID=UPI000BB7A289|nr:phage tail protein [Enterobacter hormaechei]
MTVKYKTVITKAGAEKLAAATVPNGKKVNFTAMAVGDGGGTLPVPDPNQTKLVKEVWRHALNKISQDRKNKNYVVAELLIPPETGGFWMRELGLYDDTGTLMAVGNMAESYKPALAEGSGRAQTVRMVIMVSDIESVELTIDTSTVMATQDYVDDKLAEHEKSRRHPDATLNEKGFVQLSSATGSVSESLAATPKAVKEAYDLANGKYTAQDASTAQKGIVRLNSAIDSDAENLAATSKAVKIAMENANARLAKDRNGGDIPNKQLFIQNIGMQDTVNKADGAIQRSGDNMTGPLGLTRTSSFGVATENTLGGNSIAIGDSDSGFKSNGDGNIALMANGVLAGYFSENELQHHGKVLTKIFQAISTGNATEGAGGLGSQLTSGAPFYSPAIVRQNNDNNYFPLWKQIVSLQSGYPVAASMGLLTTGEPNFPQIVLHAKTDFEVNDKLWVFDVATGELRSPALIKAGGAVLNTNGDISGSAWGGELTNWLNSQLATRDANINARATVDWVNSNFNKKSTATLGFSGWSRDESTGLIMQWGNVDNARGTYTFPRAFNQTCFAVFATNKDGQGGAIDNAYGYPVSNTQFFLASKANSGQDTAYGISWFALGY